jgi:histidinol-phosphatase
VVGQGSRQSSGFEERSARQNSSKKKSGVIMSQHQERFEFAKELARRGGKSTLDYFRSNRYTVEKKTDRSPVTIADKNAERMMRSEIGNRFPTDAIVGEEFGADQGGSDYRWIIDPIDGTKSFICGVPLYGTMVGLEYQNVCIAGAVFFPALNEAIYAMKDEGCFHQIGDQPAVAAKVSNCQSFSEAVMVTSEVETFDDADSSEVYKALEAGSYVSRTWGDCYGYMLVATGRVGLMIDPVLSIWDAAAVKPIVEEAGGVFVDWSGQPRIDSGSAIGCCPGIYDEVMALLKRHRSPK